MTQKNTFRFVKNEAIRQRLEKLWLQWNNGDDKCAWEYWDIYMSLPADERSTIPDSISNLTDKDGEKPGDYW